MAVRNWWAKAYVDGRSKPVTFGPKGKDGGFSLVVYQRSEGKSIPAVEVCAYPCSDGTLHLEVWDKQERTLVKEIITRR